MNRFIVPFLGIDPQEDYKTHFIGSAFIINPGILITVGHNIKSDENKIFKAYGIVFDKNLIMLDKPAYSEYKNEFFESENHEDLAIFFLNDMREIGLKLKNYEVKFKDKAEIYGYPDYSFGNEGIQNVSTSILNSHYSTRHFSKGQNSKYLNCFQIKDILEYGYSGCPVFVNGLLSGMITYGPDKRDMRIDLPESLKFGATAIKLSYIKTIIENYLKK